MAQSVILVVAFLFPFLQTLEPGARHELVLRLRHPDGRPVAGVEVVLLKMPDRTTVGWQNTASACETDAQGLCTWQLFGGLYEFSFPEGLTPDPITRVELGEGGLNNLSVFLDRDYFMGIVMADLLTEAPGGNLFFDRTPDQPVPQFLVPGQEDARQHHLGPTSASNVVVVDLDQEASTAGPDASEETPFTEEEGAAKSSRVLLLLLLVGLTSLIVAAFFIRRHSLLVHDSSSTPQRVDEPENDEGGPWA